MEVFTSKLTARADYNDLSQSNVQETICVRSHFLGKICKNITNLSPAESARVDIWSYELYYQSQVLACFRRKNSHITKSQTDLALHCLASSM